MKVAFLFSSPCFSFFFFNSSCFYFWHFSLMPFVCVHVCRLIWAGDMRWWCTTRALRMLVNFPKMALCTFSWASWMGHSTKCPCLQVKMQQCSFLFNLTVPEMIEFTWQQYGATLPTEGATCIILYLIFLFLLFFFLFVHEVLKCSHSVFSFYHFP